MRPSAAGAGAGVFGPRRKAASDTGDAAAARGARFGARGGGVSAAASSERRSVAGAAAGAAPHTGRGASGVLGMASTSGSGVASSRRQRCRRRRGSGVDSGTGSGGGGGRSGATWRKRRSSASSRGDDVTGDYASGACPSEYNVGAGHSSWPSFDRGAK